MKIKFQSNNNQCTSLQQMQSGTNSEKNSNEKSNFLVKQGATNKGVLNNNIFINNTA